MLSILQVPPLAVLDGLLHRPVPGAATLDGGGPLTQLPRPFRLQHLDRAHIGTLGPYLHAPQLAPLLHQVGVGLAVRLELLVPVARSAFAVGGTVSCCRASWYSSSACLACSSTRPRSPRRGFNARSTIVPQLDGRLINSRDNSNFSEYDNPAVNRLIDQALAAPDRDRRAALWGQIDERVMRDAPWVPLIHDRWSYFW
jgi:hypothetical protein